MKRVFATLAVGAAFVMAGQVPAAFAAPSSTATSTTAPAPAPASPSAKVTPAPTAKPAPTAAPQANGAPTAGRFCKKDLAGKTAKASDGTTLTCTAGSDGRNRWTSK